MILNETNKSIFNKEQIEEIRNNFFAQPGIEEDFFNIVMFQLGIFKTTLEMLNIESIIEFKDYKIKINIDPCKYY